MASRQDFDARQGQRDQEEACARTFVEQLESERGVNLALMRAEDISDLRGRWDFVFCIQPFSLNGNWSAIEIKALVNSDERKQFGSWERFIKAVEAKAVDGLTGTYSVFGFSQWNFTQEQAKQIANAFISIISTVGPSMDRGDIRDIGPELSTQFHFWPKKPADIDLETWREKGERKFIQHPQDFHVSKIANDGSKILWAYGTGAASDAVPDIQESIEKLFGSDGERGVRANIQLAEAKAKGATQTYLLLDSHIDFDPDTISHALGCLDQSQFSDIDAIYLVDIFDNRVAQVWS